MAWATKHAESFGKDLRKSVGPSVWAFVNSDVREALVAERVLSILLGQAADTIDRAAAQQLLTDARRGAGLPDEREA